MVRNSTRHISLPLAVLLLATAWMVCSINTFATPVPGPAVPVSDSLVKQQRDSILLILNFEYLEGVNEKQSPFELIPIIREILTLDAAQYQQWFNLGFEYTRIHEFHRAIEAFEKGLVLYPYKDNATVAQVYIGLAFCYNKVEKFQKEKEILDVASVMFPDNPGILGRYVLCAHSRMRFHEAEQYLKQLSQALRDKGLNEAEIAYQLGQLYLNTDILVAEDYFRTAYYYLPDDPDTRGALAWVLIQNALRINEGMNLMKQALEQDPGNPVFMHELGYGYFILGEYDSALFNMKTAEKNYDGYSFELDNHIRMVEEALASKDE